jgi:hypothetical protein
MKSTKTVQRYKDTARDKNHSSEVNTKNGFADPDRIKEQNPKDMPKDGIRSPWDFTCPQYDQRSSNFVNAGTHFGIAMKQPVGHTGNPKMTVPTLPQKRQNTTQDDDLG